MVKKPLKRLVLPALAVLAAFIAYLYLRPVPAIKPISQIITLPKTQAISLPWPSAGQAAIGAHGYGVLARSNNDAVVPVGSIAKIITALTVLKQKPIAAGNQGPTITLGSSDVGFFNYYYLKDGSVANVNLGEQITEYQALETMLLPSANNMADSLAAWAFGSINAYITYANQMVKSLGLASTKVGDTNGFSDTTTSTASDLVNLGIAAMDNPVVAQIVGQSSAQVPVAGTIQNLNSLLGSDGVVGIKTGNTDKAGGCYLFASQQNISGHALMLVGAILGQSSLADAVGAAPALIQASDSGFEAVTILHKGQALGYYKASWAPADSLEAAKDVNLFIWKGSAVKLLNGPDTLTTPASAGAQVGSLTVQSGQQTASSPLLLSQTLPGPSWHWRIFRK